MEENNRPISAPVQPAAKPESTFVPPSEFRGRTIQLIGWQLLGILLSVVTLGIGAPWAHCMVIRWETKHTYIGGKQLCFDGKGHQLLGRYLLWGLLTVITLGIYALFVPVRMHKWRAGHTRFARFGEVQKGPSGGMIFGIVMAAVAVVAVAALMVVLLTKETDVSRPRPSVPGGLEAFYSGSHEDGYQFYIDADGQYVVVFPGGQGTIAVSPDDIENIIVAPGGAGTVIVSPDEETLAPTTTPVQTQENDGPAPVSGPIVGRWLKISSHPSMSWEIDTYEFRSNGTFIHQDGLYDYNERIKDMGSSEYGGWSSFMHDGMDSGWYTYEDGVLTLNYTMSNRTPITSEAPTWYESKSTVVRRVSFSADGMMHFFDPKDSQREPLADFVRMTGGVLETLDHYYPDGVQ